MNRTHKRSPICVRLALQSKSLRRPPGAQALVSDACSSPQDVPRVPAYLLYPHRRARYHRKATLICSFASACCNARVRPGLAIALKLCRCMQAECVQCGRYEHSPVVYNEQRRL
eukprot:291693-Pleurochrysis_carterae.AAC.2